MASTALAATLGPPQYPLRLGRRRRHLLHAAGHRRGDGHARRADRAARAGIRLERRADFLGAGAAHHAVRIVRPVRRRVHESLRRAPRDHGGDGADRGGPAGLAGDDAGVAARSAVGRRRRRRHRADRDGARGDGRDALVQSSPRPGHGHAGGEQRHRPTGVPAADRRNSRRDYGWRMALVFVACMLARRRRSSRCCSCATGRAISICRSMAKPRSRRRRRKASGSCRC